MNVKIILKNVASYKKETTLNTDKKINLVYGLNGTGKTILSNYLYSKSKNEDMSDFQNCQDDFGNDEKIIVYNEKFIADNFLEKIPGIFTFSSENKNAAEQIKKAKQELNTLNNKKDQNKREIENTTNDCEQKKENAKNEIWKIKERHTGGDRPLDYCLNGLKGDKEKLFRHMIETQKPENRPQESIEELQNSVQSLEAKEEFQEIPNLKVNPNEIEDMSIFQEIIVGSQNNTVTQLITKLQNSDWVKKGLDYLPDDIKGTVDCPFCQEKTITKELADNIKKYFDKSYEEKINKLKELKGNYQSIINAVKEFKIEHKENNFIKGEGDKFQLLVSQLQTALQNNLQNIENKVQNPSQAIRLENSSKEIKKLYEYIENINTKIQEHNGKIRNAQIEKNKIKDKFWKIMRYEYNQTIEFYKREELYFKEKKNQLEQEQTNIHEQIKTQRGVINTNQENTVNLETAILNINENLKNIGITDFHIQKKSDEESYFLSRNSSDSSDFKTLSEGEKTVISFLYFLELCQGKMRRTETSNKKVIVIDDPISSLSHIYVFNIAQFIKHKFFNKTGNYQMIFILTHNLYFFRELAQYTENKKNDTNNEKVKFFRIIKKTSSQISEMKREDIKNDYESYWDILKDYKKSGEAHPILPNVMRNILEYFFGFIDKDKLADALNNIDNQKYGAFVRYMNRESHFDRENITDINEIDHSLFFDAFQEVFQKIGHEAHLKKYLK